MTSYPTPRAFRRALNTDAKEVAAAHGAHSEHVKDWFYFQRLVARAFHHDPLGWLVTGGQALLIRYAAQARMSRDIDLQYSEGDDLAEAVEALARVCAVDLGDHLTFRVRSARIGGGTDRTQPIKLDVLVGTESVSVIQVDLSAGDRYPGPPQALRLRPQVLANADLLWPKALVIPVVDHLADKICIMYGRFGTGQPSTRPRDLADILLICQREPVHGPALLAALRTEAGRRQAQGAEVGLPRSFVVPNPAWESSYPVSASQVRGLVGCTTLAEARVLGERFLGPLLGAGASFERGWDPGARSWDPLET